MSDLRAAAEMAIRALELCGTHDADGMRVDDDRYGAIDALRAALAAEQPEPEAVAVANGPCLAMPQDLIAVVSNVLWNRGEYEWSRKWDAAIAAAKRVAAPPPRAAAPTDAQDAARYRWLRDAPATEQDDRGVRQWLWSRPGGAQSLDAAIDAALKAQEEK